MANDEKIAQLADLILAEHERADALAGQVAALKTICAALIATHTNRDALRDALGAMKEMSIAKALGGLASDETIDALENGINAALK